jgi:GAF domain-containing protein
MTGRTLLEGKVIHVPDVHADPDYTFREAQKLSGDPRTFVGVPLLREGKPVGALVLMRKAVRPFTDKQIELVTTFADQAVIAIENVRLFDEVQAKTRDLTEALTYQTGSGKILSVIASSPTEVGPVLNAIVESACELCEAYDAVVLLKDGDHLLFSAHHGPIDINIEKWPINRDWSSGRAFLDRKPVHVRDMLSDEGADFPDGRELSRFTGTAGIRTVLAVPLLSENESIGTILLRRTEVQSFSDKQIALLQTFADQAVIAIGNVRLFDEVQAKTRDLSEALTYQTGSANILRVIASSPTDVIPVLQAIVESACELCGAYDALVRLKEGDGLAFGAHHGPIPVSLDSVAITENSTAGLAVIGQKPVHVRDLLSPEGDSFPDAQALAREHGERTILSVPLLRENEGIGAIVLRRTEVHPFSDKQIALLQTFADQAVIAIGNVRLFEEVQAKTRDLSEALTYQTGSANILRVIASSPTDVGPVLEAIVESSCELCGAYDAVLRLKDGDILRMGAHHGPIPVDMDRWTINRGWTAGRAVVDQKPVHVHDLLSAEGDDFPEARARARTQGHRTVLSVPLMRKGESIGAITLRRNEVNPFGDKQIALLQTFADQAVIAIGNVRLFEEVQARTEDLRESLQVQTATSDVLKVISRSPDALQPVLDVIVDTSRELCGSDGATLFLLRDNKFHFTAVSGVVPKHLEALRSAPLEIGHPGSVFTRVAQQKRTLHYPNIADDPELMQGSTGLGGARALLLVPLMRDEEVIGTIVLRQSHLRPFTPRQIQAIEVFADQAVIAISNVGLFEEVQARTRDLSESLQQQTATADVLRVISASPGELEPVFQTMLENAVRLCEAKFAMLFLYEENQNQFRAVGSWNLPPAYGEFLGSNVIRADPLVPLGRVAITKQPVQVADVLLDQSYIERYPGMVGVAERGGARTLLQVPMLREDELVGTIGI